ncbi:hypothetical protein QBC34DRAFT_101784 [Podospora aff. communis PSN243]|uniref:Extracellular membrane protein CFEM domain-containing protein n=1 Tax=Podospora aff. communis PSN243 TaxID=3040156 RepID=A0AAV9GKZ3_9PEZI|nr:hypothetical protein QBC34DRAFT_101784 [Podospora aff. communis PSN243]
MEELACWRSCEATYLVDSLDACGTSLECKCTDQKFACCLLRACPGQDLSGLEKTCSDGGFTIRPSVVAASCSARTTLTDASALGTADDNATKLSSGSIAAIVCGAVTGVAVLLAIILIIRRRRRKKAHYLPPNIMYVEIDDASQTAVAELAPDSLPGPSPSIWRKKKKRSPASTRSTIHELPHNPSEKRVDEPPVPVDQPSVPAPSSAVTPSATSSSIPSATIAVDQDEVPAEAKSAVTLKRNENEGDVPMATTEDELASLEQRRVQLAERKWRLMELDRIEDEEAEIERRLTRLKDAK